MIGNFLLYNTESTAWAKAEAEGRVVYPNGWSGNSVTKYVTIPQQTDDEKWALEVSNYTTLTSSENSKIVNEVIFRWET